MFHLLQPPPPPCLLYFHAFVSLSMSTCIILLKAWLLPVTVGEHVACGWHNLTALFPVPAEAARARSFFVCVLSFYARVCMCCSLLHSIVFIAYHTVTRPLSGQETIWFAISVVTAGLHKWLCWQYTLCLPYVHILFLFLPVGFYVCLCLHECLI